TFGSFSGVKMTVEGVAVQAKAQGQPKEAPKPAPKPTPKPKGTLPKGFEAKAAETVPKSSKGTLPKGF
ncbi:MAG: hypothetical protein OES14_07700, partial [Nitrosopumilus sp.]|nr:hypothetical protein [Nitrosopumilus sp.]